MKRCSKNITHNVLVYEMGGIRITGIFDIAKTLNKCNRAFVSYATAFFIYFVLKRFFKRGVNLIKLKYTKMITATNEDNMQMMKRYEDNFFDLAIVDPPYGIGIDGQKKSISKNANHNRKEHQQQIRMF